MYLNTVQRHRELISEFNAVVHNARCAADRCRFALADRKALVIGGRSGVCDFARRLDVHVDKLNLHGAAEVRGVAARQGIVEGDRNAVVALLGIRAHLDVQGRGLIFARL